MWSTISLESRAAGYLLIEPPLVWALVVDSDVPNLFRLAFFEF